MTRPMTLAARHALLCTTAAASLFAAADAVRAQQRLDPTVVTATRGATPPDQIGSSTTVVTRQEIEEGGYRDVVDVLEGVAGVNVVQSGGRGTQTSIFMRGTESNHTLILINGVRVVDSSVPGSVYQIEHLSTADIERIEVVRGPQSVLYGSDAIGGVINIITREGSDTGAVASLQTEGGSFGTFENRAGIDATLGRLDVNFHHAFLHTDGISVMSPRVGGRERDGYNSQQFTFRTNFRANEHFEIGFYGAHLYAENDIDPFADDPNARSTYLQGLLISELRFRNLWGSRWNTTVRHSYVGIDRRSFFNPVDAVNPLPTPLEQFHSDKHKIEVISTFRIFESHRLTFGQEIEWERAKRDNAFRPFSNETRTVGLYIQDQFAIGENFFGTAGVRLDDHSRFGTEVTWRVTGTYHLRDTGTRFKGSAGTAFKTPSFDELFGFDPGFPLFGFPPTVGNPNLEPERSFGFDFGIEQRVWSGRVVFGSSFFYNDIENLVTFQAGPAVNTFVNLQDTRTYGVESFVRADLSDTFGRPVSVRLTHTYLRAEDTANGQELLRRPRNQVTFDLRVVPVERLTLNFRAVYMGYRADVGFISFGRVYEPGRIVARLAAEYRVNDYLTVFGRVENLFDSQAENPNGFNQPGIAGFAGLRLRLQVPFEVPQL